MWNQRKLTLIAIALVGIVVAFLYVQRGDKPASAAPSQAEVEASVPEQASSAELQAASGSAEARESVEVVEDGRGAPETTASASPTSEVIRGFVEDVNGVRQAGITVYFQPQEAPASHDATGGARAGEGGGPSAELGPEAITDSEGRFVLPAPSVDGFLNVATPGIISLLLPSVQAGRPSQREERLVVARFIAVSGTVQAAGGGPIEGALVRLLIPQSAPGQSDSSQRVAGSYSTRADATGRFVLDECPDIPGLKVWANHGDYNPQTLDAPGLGEELRFELEPVEVGVLLCGIVLDADGLPAEGASVSIGSMVKQTAADGTFCVNAGDRWAQWLPQDEPVELMAVGDDAYSDVVRLPSPADGLTEAWPDLLQLQLNRPRLKLHGRVVDGEGQPLKGIGVDLVDSTVFGFSESPPGSGSIGRAFRESEAGGVTSVTTGADGAFLLSGLEDRPYTVEAVDMHSLTGLTIEEVQPGEEPLEIVFDPKTRWVEGRVVYPDGEPAPDVRVTVTRTSAQRGFFLGDWMTTYTDGTFEIGPVQDDDLLLRLEGDAIVPSFGVHVPREELDDLRIVVSRRVRVRVDWSTVPEDALGVGFCDEAGERLTAVFVSGNRFSSIETIRKRIDAVYIVPEEARFALLLGAEEEETGRVLLEAGLPEPLSVRF